MFALMALGGQRISGLLMAATVVTGLLRLMPLLRQVRFERMLPIVAAGLDLRATGGQTLILLAGGFGCLLAIWGQRSRLRMSVVRHRFSMLKQPTAMASRLKRPTSPDRIVPRPAPRALVRVVKITK